MITTEQAKTELRAAINSDVNGFVDAVIAGLVAAGAEPTWDSSTIEAVLSPIQSHLTARGIPEVGNTIEDLDAYEFWLAVDGRPLPWDPYQGDEGDALKGWREAVADDETRVSFREWWDHEIETARHNLLTAGIRNRRGHYTLSMLRDGYRDQYAVLRAGGKVVVELSYDDTNTAPFVVTTIITTPTTSRSTERTFTDLDEARAAFRRIVSHNP